MYTLERDCWRWLGNFIERNRKEHNKIRWLSQNDRMVWVGRALKDHLVPTTLPCTNTPSTTQGCSKMAMTLIFIYHLLHHLWDVMQLLLILESVVVVPAKVVHFIPAAQSLLSQTGLWMCECIIESRNFLDKVSTFLVLPLIFQFCILPVFLLWYNLAYIYIFNDIILLCSAFSLFVPYFWMHAS